MKAQWPGLEWAEANSTAQACVHSAQIAPQDTVSSLLPVIVLLSMPRASQDAARICTEGGGGDGWPEEAEKEVKDPGFP